MQDIQDYLNNESSFLEAIKTKDVDSIFVEFNAGYANTEYYAKKKALINAIKIFNKFPQINEVAIEIPYYIEPDFTPLALYLVKVKRQGFFEYLEQHVVHKDNSDKLERYMHKKTVLAFDEKYKIF